MEASNSNGTVSRSLFLIPVEEGVPLITEFLASNDETLLDEDGDPSDWIELHNPGSSPLSLAGYFLSDDVTDLTKWMLPDVTLAPGEYLVVFASSKNRVNPASELHTNFSLSSAGEYLALTKPDGVLRCHGVRSELSRAGDGCRLWTRRGAGKGRIFSHSNPRGSEWRIGERLCGRHEL